MAKIYSCIFFALSFTYVNCYAQDRINTDRPDQTEAATLTPAHYFQAEFGFSHVQDNEDDFTNIYPTYLLKYGLTKNFEFRLENDFVTVYKKLVPNSQTVTGFRPLEPGFRLGIFDGNNILPRTSLIAHVAIPSFASKNFRANHLAPRILLAMENDITKKIGLGYNAGVEWDGFSTIPAWLYSISCDFDLGEKWDCYLEIYGSAEKKSFPENTIDGGIGYFISNNMKLDLSAGFGINKAASDFYMGAGFSFRVK